MPRTPEQVREEDGLIDAVRAGRTSAYARLYLLHRTVALWHAHRVARSASDAEDLVAEAFARVLVMLRRGGGPNGRGFRAYLLTAVGNIARDRSRRDDRVEPVEDLEDAAPAQLAVPFDDTVTGAAERALVRSAFVRLPERWWAVLWHTEVQGRSPAEVAPLLGMTANGVSALAYRAREGLRQAYLQAHLDRADAAPACQSVVTRLGAWARGGLVGSAAGRVRDRLKECARCRALLTDLTDVAGPLTRAA